jgi:hypothetical protein
VPKHPDFAAVQRIVASAIATAEKPPVSASSSPKAGSSASKKSSASAAGSGSTAAATGQVDAKAVCSAG